jgi:hypothetical protein
VDDVKELFCAAVPDLALRRIGERIPFRLNAPNNEAIDGGGGLLRRRLGPGLLPLLHRPLELQAGQKVGAWARETRSRVLVGWPYRGSALLDQGHVGIPLQSGYVLQCFSDPNGPDLNWICTIERFGAGIKHALMVHPKNWIEYREDLAEWAKDKEAREAKSKRWELSDRPRHAPP